MKILVTGSSGFIGSKICKELEKNKDITLIKTTSKQELATNGVKFLDLDNFDSSLDLYQYFDCPDMILHCAWQNIRDVNSAQHLEDFLPRHKSFLKNLISNGIHKVIILGTGFEYGNQNGEMVEGVNSVSPNTRYAEAKDSLRMYVEELNYSFVFQWLRVFYVYEALGVDGDNIVTLLKKSIDDGDVVFRMSKGDQLLDYIEVRSLAVIVAKVILQDKVTGCINCCTGEPITLLNMINKRLKDWGKSIELDRGFYPYREFESMAIWGSTEKLERAIEYKKFSR